uniref:Uncharacterized protein n=1 Tax=Tupiella akineta TaxID=160070 RepID=Q3ZJ52_TUPAK|nr:hypothetical protein PsakCp041 [Tupiella akineta]AAV80639.1 hypothetical protein [Tupiella akineta]
MTTETKTETNFTIEETCEHFRLDRDITRTKKLKNAEFGFNEKSEDFLFGITKLKEKEEEAGWFQGFLDKFVQPKDDQIYSPNFISKNSFSGCPDSRELRLIPIQFYYIYLKFNLRRDHKEVFWQLEEHFNQDIVLSSIFTYWFENRFQTTQQPEGAEDIQFLKDYHMDLKFILVKLGYKKEKVISATRMLKGMQILLQNHPEKKGYLIKKNRTAQGLILINTRLVKIDPFGVFIFTKEE